MHCLAIRIVEYEETTFTKATSANMAKQCQSFYIAIKTRFCKCVCVCVMGGGLNVKKNPGLSQMLRQQSIQILGECDFNI